jgi:hypothetical protein
MAWGADAGVLEGNKEEDEIFDSPRPSIVRLLDRLSEPTQDEEHVISKYRKLKTSGTTKVVSTSPSSSMISCNLNQIRTLFYHRSCV